MGGEVWVTVAMFGRRPCLHAAATAAPAAAPTCTPPTAHVPSRIAHPSACPPCTRLQNTNKREVAWMFWILLLLLLVSRALFVVPVTLAHNRFSDHKLSMREMVTIWWAGLMRGAVSGEQEGRGSHTGGACSS